MFNIRSLTVGIVATNCYLVWNKSTKEGVLIDPGDEAERISAAIEEERVKLKAILLTHGHFDHILVAEELQKKYEVPLYASKEEKDMLENPQWNLSGMDEGVTITDYIPVQDGDKLELLGTFRISSVEIPFSMNPTDEPIFTAVPRRRLRRA